MFGGMDKSKLLEKILELFSSMPDKEDLKDGGADEASEPGEPQIGDNKIPMKGTEVSIVGLDGGKGLDGLLGKKQGLR